MNEFFSSVKSDLLDRRLRPLVALVAVLLLAAIGYAAFAGGSSPTVAPASSAATGATATAAGVAVREATTQTQQPVAETTNGVAQQRGGRTRNPFSPVAGVKTASAASASQGSSTAAKEPSTSSGASAGGGGGSETSSKSGGGETTPSGSEEKTAEAKKPTKKPGKQTVYRVTAKFGAAPAGTPPASAQLTPFANLKRQQPLPSSSQPLVVFRGVTAGGKSATFTLVGEAILRGEGACQPDPSQCLAIDLKPGQFEELEYLPPGGIAVVYQLQVVKIESSKASAAAARAAFRGESKAGVQFLRIAGLAALPGLRYSADKGVLVFARHPAFAARAHVAAWGASLRG
jgi:hypothetical protein